MWLLSPYKSLESICVTNVNLFAGMSFVSTTNGVLLILNEHISPDKVLVKESPRY